MEKVPLSKARTVINKQLALTQIARQIAGCRACKKGTLGKPVPGEGNADADIVFVGEAPGKQEASSGRPFIGRSGKLLRSAIRQIGLREKEIFITSPVKYLPKRGTPTAAAIVHGRSHLFKQLAVIEPKIVVMLGRTACRGVLGDAVAVIQRHGEVVKDEGRYCFITFHPAAVVRFPKYKPQFAADFRKLKSLIRKLK